MTTITAKTILRSRHAQRPDKVLSTLLLRYPRCIHAEFMTHRQLSRNAGSSRALPVAKLIQDVMDDPFIPLHWGKNQKGMQAAEEHDAMVMDCVFDGSAPRETAWLWARDKAVLMAEAFSRAGYHKQIVNRLLEPFAHITVVASGTEWSNFRALREHKDAEPHIQILAQEIGRELDREDNIQTLEPGQWHLPFITDDDHTAVRQWANTNRPSEEKCGKPERGWGIKYHDGGLPWFKEAQQRLIKKSVACSASTSYKTVDGFDMTLEKAIELHDKLVGSTPLHASPAEHVAQADSGRAIGHPGDTYMRWDNPRQHANFEGFRQYRKMLPNECL